MTQVKLLKTLDEWDKQGVWVFNIKELYMAFSDESEDSVKKSLSRHEKSGFIKRICKGFYANPRAKSISKYPLEFIATQLRYKVTTYLSLESVLSEEGLISQIPNRLTFISKGASKEFKTPYGIIEFTHTNKDVTKMHKDCYYDKNRGIYVANVEQAISDIYQHNRSVDLYEEQLAKDKGEYYGLR